jgi:TPR repeat protein
MQKRLNQAYDELKNYYRSCSGRRAKAEKSETEKGKTKQADGAKKAQREAEFNANDISSPSATVSYMNVVLDLRFNSASKQEAKNLADAMRTYEQIAKLGHSRAQFRLGYLYFAGICSKDLAKAAYWWELSAENGNIAAQFNLALLFERGLGVQRNWLKAQSWLNKAAKAGDRQAQRKLAKTR